MSVIRGAGRPLQYLTASGERVPSWSTIAGNRKTGTEALMVWANRQGREGRDHREVRDEAAGAGALAHAMVENSIHGLEPLHGITTEQTEPQILRQAQGGFAAFEAWQRVYQVEYVATETPMVSEQWRYGGTPDAIGRVKGELMLFDWKTSNRVFGDYVIQLAAYRQLWNENHKSQLVTCATLLRFGKDQGDFHVHFYPEKVLEMGWNAFWHLRRLYDLDKELKKVAS